MKSGDPDARLFPAQIHQLLFTKRFLQANSPDDCSRSSVDQQGNNYPLQSFTITRLAGPSIGDRPVLLSRLSLSRLRRSCSPRDPYSKSSMVGPDVPCSAPAFLRLHEVHADLSSAMRRNRDQGSSSGETPYSYWISTSIAWEDRGGVNLGDQYWSSLTRRSTQLIQRGRQPEV